MNQESDHKDIKDPSVLVFIAGHTVFTIKEVVSAIIDLFRNIITILTASWMIPYAGLLYNEVLSMYFEECKKKKLPFIRMPSFIMSGAIGDAIKGDFKKILRKRLKEKHGGITFAFKMVFVPFHYISVASEDQVNFSKTTEKYNTEIAKEYQKEDGSIDDEKVGAITMKAMEAFHNIFMQKEQEDE